MDFTQILIPALFTAVLIVVLVATFREPKVKEKLPSVLDNQKIDFDDIKQDIRRASNEEDLQRLHKEIILFQKVYKDMYEGEHLYILLDAKRQVISNKISLNDHQKFSKIF